MRKMYSQDEIRNLVGVKFKKLEMSDFGNLTYITEALEGFEALDDGVGATGMIQAYNVVSGAETLFSLNGIALNGNTLTLYGIDVFNGVDISTDYTWDATNSKWTNDSTEKIVFSGYFGNVSNYILCFE